MNNTRGFTLIEVIVTMALVLVIIMISGSAFDTIIKNTSKLTSSEEGNIEGVVGLEIFRHDLQQMGFGLPHAYSTAPVYSEAAAGSVLANSLNDAPSGVPRAFVSLDSATGTNASYNVLPGSDYLGIKATTVGRNRTSQKWTFLAYTSMGGKSPNRWINADDNLIDSQSKVVVLNRSFSSGIITNTLVYNAGDPSIYWANYYDDSLADTAFYPTSPQQVYYLYGVDDSALRMPFNRSDYFVARPSDTTRIPTTCAPNTGILYKANVNHGDGLLSYIPILDCVADMQVVYGWDFNGNGVFDETSAYNSSSITVSNGAGSTTTSADVISAMTNADTVRKKLKYIKVYIMAQDGRRDPNFTNNSKIVVGDLEGLTKGYDIDSGGGATKLSNCGGRTINPCNASNNWLHYRWKIYKIVVRPKNL